MNNQTLECEICGKPARWYYDAAHKYCKECEKMEEREQWSRPWTPKECDQFFYASMVVVTILMAASIILFCMINRA